MTPADNEAPVTAMCIFGGPVDVDGVCVEHGETACVVTLHPEH